MLFPLPGVLFSLLSHPSAWLTHLYSSSPGLETTLSKPGLGVPRGVPRTTHDSPVATLSDLVTYPCDQSIPGIKE